jgi:hypothetical protein
VRFFPWPLLQEEQTNIRCFQSALISFFAVFRLFMPASTRAAVPEKQKRARPDRWERSG